MEIEISRVSFEISRLEQNSRKSSRRVYGIQEEEGEKVGEKVLSKMKEETGVEISADEVDRWRDRPRAVMIKFVSHRSKIKVMKKKKSANTIKISEDLSKGTRLMLNKIYANKDAINVEKAWTIDGRIKYKLRNMDKVQEIRSFEDYKNLMDNTLMDH